MAKLILSGKGYQVVEDDGETAISEKDMSKHAAGLALCAANARKPEDVPSVTKKPKVKKHEE